MATTYADGGVGSEQSIFQSDLPAREKLDRARTELLDLSARNRLLNMPRASKSARAIEVVDELSSEVFRLLVRDGRVFTFVAGRSSGSSTADSDGIDTEEEEDEVVDLAQPEDDEVDARGVHARHADTRLQTRLTSKGLQKRLLDLFFDARTLEEEQGVNILFLALGALKWIDPQNAANVRHAPLLLVPVSLERGNAGEKFKLRVRQEDYASNLSLEAFLDRLHGIRLPAFEAADAFDPAVYFAQVADAVSAKPGWSVLPDDMVLGFFSFAKFLMYRDLDPENWPAAARITDRPLVRGLLSDGFEGSDGLIPEDANIDPFIPPSEMLHIVDSDSSQALAVHEVRRGRDLVIQGPPGTGKSQTIANVIASAVADGKSVLFVAEKMAALDVVKRRLDATGVGDACLELHSSKANKRAVLEELRRTWELGAPRGQQPGTLYARLTEARDALNAHSARMHRAHAASGLTPFQAIGQLSRLRLDGEKPGDLRLDCPEDWSRDGFAERLNLVADLAGRVMTVGRPDEHVWLGVGLSSILPTEVERLTAAMSAAAARLAKYDDDMQALASDLRQCRPTSLGSLETLADVASRVASAPDVGEALASPAWTESVTEIGSLLAIGRRHAGLRSDLDAEVAPAGWFADLSEPLSALSLLPARFDVALFERLGELATGLPRLLAEAGSLAGAVGLGAPTTLSAAVRLAMIGERVAAAPPASAEAFAADLWDAGVARAADLADAVASLESARASIGDGLAEAAWATDLSEARTVLAMHGTGFFKVFSGDWRRCSRLVRSVLARPDAELDDVLALLDALAAGQAARRAIVADDEFGRAAFGADWRGERSAAAPLVALVEWMRSLRGLGAEPRMVAARLPDKGDVGSRAARVSTTATALASAYTEVWDGLGETRGLAFGDSADAVHADVAAVLAFASRLHSADRAVSTVLAKPPLSLEERLRLLDDVVRAQEAAAAITEGGPLGRSAFGVAWSDAGSDWERLAGIARWVERNADVRTLAGGLEDRMEPDRRARTLVAERDAVVAEASSLLARLELDRPLALGADEPAELDARDLGARLELWSVSGEKLFEWVAYRDRAGRAEELGCGDVVARLADGRLTPEGAVSAFEMAYFEAVYAD